MHKGRKKLNRIRSKKDKKIVVQFVLIYGSSFEFYQRSRSI